MNPGTRVRGLAMKFGEDVIKILPPTREVNEVLSKGEGGNVNVRHVHQWPTFADVEYGEPNYTQWSGCWAPKPPAGVYKQDYTKWGNSQSKNTTDYKYYP